MKISRRKLSIAVPSVAMADIAFNLVLFFIMMAKTQDDSHLKWLPAKGSQLEKAQNSKVSLVVDVQNKMYLNGKEIGQVQLKNAIEEELRDLPIGKRTVMLKVHKETTAQRFEPLIEAVSQAGGEMVHVLELER